jgi:cytochrome P450
MEDESNDSINFFSPEAASCPQPVLNRLRDRCPVGQAIPGGSVCVSRYEDVMFALRNPQIFTSELPAGLIGNKRSLIPLQIDPPRQTRYRKLLDPIFSRKRMVALEPDFRALAGDLVDRFVDKGECEFNEDFAVPYPSTVFARLMGLPMDDIDTFLEIKDGIIRPTGDTAEEIAAVRAAASDRVYEYMGEMFDERMSHPREDLMSHLVTAELDGQKLTREELLDISFLMIIAGLDTVTATLGCSVAYLAEHPDRRRALVGDPALLETTVEELLRWETPVVQIVRMLTQDYEFHGVSMRKGDIVTLVLGAANLDEAQFEDAGVVDFGREVNKHLAFGGGAHRCLGSHLARQELMIALDEFHRRIPDYAIKPGETPVYTPAIREVKYLPLVFD